MKTNTKDTNSQDSIHSTEEANQNVDSITESLMFKNFIEYDEEVEDKVVNEKKMAEAIEQALTKSKEQGAREEREKLSRFVGMRYPKTDETKELIAEIIKALKPQK